MSFIKSIFFLSLIVANTVHAQLKPGFDKKEYLDLLTLAMHFDDSSMLKNKEVPADFKPLYFAQETGLHNKWALWLKSDSTAILSFRGTVNVASSWLENLYCGMVAAKGFVVLAPQDTFHYQLAQSERAYVHSGWLIGFAYMARDVKKHVDSLYQQGIKKIIVTGHSQGGAMSFLFTAWLRQMQLSGELPADIVIKTYASAGPKPGNIYFAYEYENSTRGSWAFNVVNAGDWVPESPFTIQTLQDMSVSNPFKNVDNIVRKQSFFKRIVFRHVYNQLKEKPEKAAKAYNKYLGKYIGKMLQKDLPQYEFPPLITNSYFARAGEQITLIPNDEYHKQFPQNSKNVFDHHSLKAYRFLVNQYY